VNNPQEHFLTLCNLWCEQQLSDENLLELQSLLRTDRSLQLMFVEFTQLHGQLAWDAGVLAGSNLTSVLTEATALQYKLSPVASPWSRFSVRMATAVAACLLLAGLGSILWHPAAPINVADTDLQSITKTNSAIEHRVPGENAAANPNVVPPDEPNHLAPLPLNGMLPDSIASTSRNDAGVPLPPGEMRVPSDDAPAVALDDAAVIAEIDRLVAAAWADNDVVPAQQADDYEWVRRCYLTLSGRIPTVIEASTFVARKSPRKRSELVDSLLDDPRYAESLSVTWTNLLIGRSNVGKVDEGALYDFLLRQFSANRPWMETVGDLIAAEGRSDQNGATNFLLAHLNDKATPATAVTARLFLGQQVQCTQCHDHPFAKDRHQDEFWSLNAFFKQAERKPLAVKTVDGREKNVLVLSDSAPAGMTFYETLRGQEKAVLPEFDGHAMAADDSSSRRSELVRLLAADSHQMVAKAMVNRSWAQVFGYGFSNPIDDLGFHNPVSHPELVSLLTQSFVDSDYDVRRLMRWLTLSQSFQLSSVQSGSSLALDDPEEGGTPLFSRAYPRQMAPEQVYDSIRIAIRSAAAQPIDSSIGSTHRREWVEQFVRAYGTDENDEQLAFEGNIAQAMLMMNGEDLQAAIPMTAAEVTKAVHSGPQGIAKTLERIAMATLNREPSAGEEKVFRSRYRALTRSLPADQAIRTATEDMLWAYLNSSEFTSVH